MNTSCSCAAVVAWAACLLAGCGSKLPVYPAMGDAESFATIADRQASVKTLSAECDLDLTDASGQRVSLDGVMVASLPGKVRLRAWKFGHVIFDLTMADGKGWVMAPDDARGTRRFDAESLPTKQVRDAMDLLGPAYFRAAKHGGGDERVLRARGPALGRDDVECEIDRPTLTPRRFVVDTSEAPVSTELLMDDYEVVGAIVWPMRVRLKSPSGEVSIRFRSVELNGTLPDGAFTPPSRAKALP